MQFHPLTPERWDDFEALFGARGAYSGCWCMWWRLKRKEFEAQQGDGNRAAMKAIVESGRVPGILGYDGDRAVAWCSVAPREDFPSLNRSPVLKRLDDEPVWSIVEAYPSVPKSRNAPPPPRASGSCDTIFPDDSPRESPMALSAFDDKAKQPRASDLQAMLGRSYTHWQELIAHVASEFAPLDQSWNFAGANWGWSLRLKRKKRTVLYMTPCQRHFLVGFVLGDKAVKAAHDGTLPDALLAEIDGARKYAEGRGIRIRIGTRQDLDNVKRLAAIKMAS